MVIIEKLGLKGKTALVTGGGRGLGYIFCRALAEAGASVCVVDIDIDSARGTAESMSKDYGIKTLAIGADVSDELSIESMYKQFVEVFGVLDICVANAGIFVGGKAEEMTLKDWNKTLAVNLTGVFLTCRGAARIMIPRRQGSIINIASINGHVASYVPGCSYCASKGAVLSFTRAVASEWGKYNIRVNSISPGNMHTDMTDQDSINREYFEIWKKRTSLSRLGNPQELQSALIYLASNLSSYTTGSDIIVDGGHTAL